MNVPFRVASTAALSNEHLPSPAQFVLVDNTSNQWLYQPDAQRYIAPYAMNITMPLTVANGANMQVASPPGVTQAAPIAGQQYLAVFSDTEPSGLPYTSQTNVEITNGTVDATITGGTIDAVVTNSSVNIQDVTAMIPMSSKISIQAALNQTWQKVMDIGNGTPVSYIRGWQASNASGGGSGGLIQLALGTDAARDSNAIFHCTYASPYGDTSIILPPGLAILTSPAHYAIWLYTDLSGLDSAVTIYYSDI